MLAENTGMAYLTRNCAIIAHGVGKMAKDLLEKTSAQPVGEFLSAARNTVETHMPPCWLAGEVTNFTRAASGHWYFILRDAEGQIDCIMLRQYNALLPSPPADGDAVEVLAQPTIFTARGRFQLKVRLVRHTGDGKWLQLYASRKREFAKRGWFDRDVKQTPPSWPETVGVVGSPNGAAVRDVIRTLKTRMPSVNVILYPAPAQGEDAAPKIAKAIVTANKRSECQTLIICRGGGGIEDMWSFNEEEVVSAVVNSGIPVISGIGHEIDETLIDLAADVRAPTPTGAAVFATPDKSELQQTLLSVAVTFNRAAHRAIDERTQSLDLLTTALRRPATVLTPKRIALQQAASRLVSVVGAGVGAAELRFTKAAAHLTRPKLTKEETALEMLSARFLPSAKRCIQNAEAKINHAAAVLHGYNPQNTLSRGYGIIRDATGRIVTDGGVLESGDMLHMQFAKGEAQAEVRKNKK